MYRIIMTWQRKDNKSCDHKNLYKHVEMAYGGEGVGLIIAFCHDWLTETSVAALNGNRISLFGLLLVLAWANV